MLSGLFFLDLVMQFPDIMGKGKKYALCFHIFCSTAQESPEAHILLDITK